MWIWRTLLVRAQKKVRKILLENRGRGSHCFIAAESLADVPELQSWLLPVSWSPGRKRKLAHFYMNSHQSTGD